MAGSRVGLFDNLNIPLITSTSLFTEMRSTEKTCEGRISVPSIQIHEKRHSLFI